MCTSSNLLGNLTEPEELHFLQMSNLSVEPVATEVVGPKYE